GAFAFASDTGQFDVPNDDPFTPDTDVINQTFISIFGIPIIFVSQQELRLFNPNERVNIGQVSKNEMFGRDNVWGGGAHIKYFWSRYLMSAPPPQTLSRP